MFSLQRTKAGQYWPAITYLRYLPLAKYVPCDTKQVCLHGDLDVKQERKRKKCALVYFETLSTFKQLLYLAKKKSVQHNDL